MLYVRLNFVSPSFCSREDFIEVECLQTDFLIARKSSLYVNIFAQGGTRKYNEGDFSKL
jgi:hypothetical protein